MPYLAFLICAGCASLGPRYERHFDGKLWSQGFEQQFERREQIVPAASLLVLTPLLLPFDRDLSEDAVSHQPITGGSSSSGEALSSALVLASIGWGAVEWYDGDSGQSLEVAGESLIATSLATEILKKTTHRQRPSNSSSSSSFPSGAASAAFAGATFLARRGEARYGTKLGYWLYAPAALVAIHRVETGRHFPSDVAAGAFLGIFLTNLVYNAHYGDERTGRAGIFPSRPTARWSVGPELLDEGWAIGLHLDL